jgi:hypothetical protein
MSTATALQRIAERLRTINTDSAANAERYIQRHTGDACRLIQPHWQTIVSRAGIDWTGPEPFPAAEPCDPVTDLQLWALAWQSIAGVLWISMRGHHWPGMPELTTTRREPGLSVSTVTHNAADWRERANDYAEICDALAGWLSEEPDGDEIKPQKPAKRIRTKKRWTFPEIDTHIEQVLKSQDPEKIKAYVFESDEELATRIGCNKKTLYKTRFWQDERERMQAEWRRLNTAGEIPKKRDQ